MDGIIGGVVHGCIVPLDESMDGRVGDGMGGWQMEGWMDLGLNGWVCKLG